ncbi:MAG TPA: FMN-binding protein [Spirochaetales bacterium]|nr:FMN-binding protein [Spirochaetales bacterium]
MKKESLGYVVIFTFVVCALFVFVLAAANQFTKAQATANREFTEKAAVLDALGIAWNDKAQAASIYDAQVTRIDGSSPRAYRSTIDGTEYLAVEQSGAGLWGTITIILAATPDAGRIRGIQLIAQNETPGLGGRIGEAWFLSQFRGEKSDGGVRVATGAESKGTGDTNPDNGVLDGVSGASRTSSAFEAIVNNALKRVRAVAGGTL